MSVNILAHVLTKMYCAGTERAASDGLTGADTATTTATRRQPRFRIFRFYELRHQQQQQQRRVGSVWRFLQSSTKRH